MSTYIFSTFWPILKVLQILGLFPIKKSSENLCGFQAMPTGKYLVLILTVQSLGIAFFFVPLFLVMSKYNFSFLDLLHTMIALNGSPLDDITYFGIMIMITICEIGVVIGMFSLKSQIIKLLELFQEELSTRHTKLQATRKSKKMLLLLIIGWLFFPIVDTFAYLMRLINHINVDISTAVMFGVLHFVSMIIVNAGPLCSFLMLFSEPCYQLNAWMKCLTQKVESKEQLDQKIIYECKKLFYEGKGLKLIRLTNVTLVTFLIYYIGPPNN